MRKGNGDERRIDEARDATLGGYLEEHSRPPGFQGGDGHPYTVSIEVEESGNLRTPWAAYLVFPRWARTGIGIVGHLESGVLGRARTRAEARSQVESLTLHQVREILDEAIRRQG